MFFPPQVIFVPLFRLWNGMGLIDTLRPVIIVHSALGIPICVLMMRNFFATVPNALREAAIMAGASEWQVLTRVVLPLSLQAPAVLATLQFTWIWTDFLWPLIFTQSDNTRTIMIGIVNLKRQYSVAWGVQGALSLAASLPTLLVFLFFQRFFSNGMTALFPHLTVADNFGFGLQLQKQSRATVAARVAEVAETLRLTTLPARYPRELSGGAAPACHYRPGHHPQSEGVPVRRAAFQPGRGPSGPDEAGDRPTAPPSGGDDGLRHA